MTQERATRPYSPALAELAALVDRLGRTPVETATATLSTPAMKPLRAVSSFQSTWSRLRVEQRLREALAQVPAEAGPLNSSHLVNRTLQTLRDLSPAYLDAFMAHVDTLQWLEQSSGAGDLTPRAASTGESSKRRPAAKVARKG